MPFVFWSSVVMLMTLLEDVKWLLVPVIVIVNGLRLYVHG
jgi:hypothetical protein